ncbi:MAG TPA: cyclic pyranopterin monophosphate synthase MoaC [Spirochaetota bacterium]|nr:cyclic pyranopterin monophosphate synthase MoaC [Spirochaetota bacterium]HOL56063.1 cyclic pyranopterin monophosphate synthase MoaC [Spirochaetota bacterium]HPP03209.1 cyclic pyranopterin monophosphate synthase MoaC [Spirochaetota bacterium]
MDFTHLDKEGNVKMVDITKKEISKRIAIAKGIIKLQKETIEKIVNGNIKKGNVLTTAKIAGIMAAKNSFNIIPLCHQIQLTGIDINFNILEEEIEIESVITAIDKTGAEMEALTSVSVAALTIYDMCKAIDKNMVIKEIKLCHKSKQSV